MYREAALALGADVTFGSAIEAGPVSRQGMLRLASLELPAKALLDLVGAFLEGVVDLVVVALFRAAAVSSITDRLYFGSGVTYPCGAKGKGLVDDAGVGSGRVQRKGVAERGNPFSPRIGGAIEGRGGEDSLIGADGAQVMICSGRVVGEVMADLVLKEGETS